MQRLITILIAAGALSLAAGCTTPYGNQPTSPPPSEPDTNPTSEPTYDPPPTSGTTGDDQEIHDRVHDALYRNMGDDAGDITVRVENGDVFLSGCVDSEAQHDRAHDLAHQVSGVESVNHSELDIC